jgi:hypothetical protein
MNIDAVMMAHFNLIVQGEREREKNVYEKRKTYSNKIYTVL